jgi:hypothetical protein
MFPSRAGNIGTGEQEYSRPLYAHQAPAGSRAWVIAHSAPFQGLRDA